MRRRPSLTTDDVLKIVAACKAAGARIKREPTVAVVDAGGHLLHLERPDHNGVITVDVATLKARTAALRGRPSSAFEARVKERPGFMMTPNCLGVEGGIPILFEDECAVSASRESITTTRTSPKRARLPLKARTPLSGHQSEIGVNALCGIKF